MKASFYTAIEDDCIRKNPFDFALDTVLEDDTEEKIALTQKQEDSLLDFANRQINLGHQILKDSETGYYVDAPKTKNGIRQIPMSDKVYEALKRAVKNGGKAAVVNIDGYKNFLFYNQSGYPKVASGYESMFKGLVKKYNKQHKEDKALPNITPHTLRHTFCTRLANAGMNLKALQYIMDHFNIAMTLNYYAHATYVSAKAEMDRLAA